MLKVLITGPESSGKTQLAQSLARRFQSPWVPEFARTYLAALEGTYQEEDLLHILNGQLRLQQQHHTSPFLFCDTGPEVIYIWSKVKYGRADPYIRQSLRKYRYDLNLLCYPDLNWEPDPLREAPDPESRLRLFQAYEELFRQEDVAYTIVEGQGEQRKAVAFQAVEALYASSK